MRGQADGVAQGLKAAGLRPAAMVVLPASAVVVGAHPERPSGLWPRRERPETTVFRLPICRIGSESEGFVSTKGNSVP